MTLSTVTMSNRKPNKLRPSRAAREEDVSLGLGEELHCFQAPNLQRQNEASDVRLVDFEPISSYSWVNESGIPMIAVPGKRSYPPSNQVNIGE